MDQIARDAAIIRRQQERIFELEEMLRQSKEDLPPPARFFPFEWNITPVCARGLWALYDAHEGFVSSEDLQSIMINRTDADAPGAVRVHIWRLRNLLDPMGVEIINRRKYGYQLTPASKAIIKAVLSERMEAA